MKGFVACLVIQLKRVRKVFLFIFCMTLLLMAGVSLLAAALLQSDTASERRVKVKIGLVGDVEDTYLGFGIVALQRLDPTRYAIEFLPMTEQEAKASLSMGEISAYAVIPEGFVDSVDRGENRPITYATNNDATGVGALLMRELLDVVSEMITESQNAVYATQVFLSEKQMWDTYNEATDELFIRLVSILLNRTDLYKVACFGTIGGLSLYSHYFLALLLFFMLLWGMTCSSIFVKRNISLTCLMKARGQSVFSQIAAEYMAYLVLMMTNIYLLVLPLIAVFQLSGLQLEEWKTVQASEQFLFLPELTPVMAVIAAMQFFLYELISDRVSGILLQFLVAVSLAFLSGCFYPVTSLPKIVQRMAPLLPTGAALGYAGKCMQAAAPVKEAGILSLYFLIFIGLSVAVRKRKMVHE